MNTTIVSRAVTFAVIVAGLEAAVLERPSSPSRYAVGMPMPASEESQHTPHRELPAEPRIAETVVISSATVSAVPDFIKTPGWVGFKLL